MKICCCIVLAAGLISDPTSHAQTQSPVASSVAEAPEFGMDSAYENIFIGPAATVGDTARATFTGGLTIGQYFAKPLGKGIVASPQFELGILGPLPNGHPIDGLASVDFMFANKVPRRNLYPFMTGGYTRLFATGNAVNFGVGIDLGKRDSSASVRIELRDYYLFTSPQQHIVGLRIGFGNFISD